MKPFPIIKLDKIADHEKLFRGLYNLGYKYSHTNPETAWQLYLRGQGEGIGYPIVAITDAKYFSVMETSSIRWIKGVDIGWDGGIRRKYAKMNSVSHFLLYAKGLRKSYELPLVEKESPKKENAVEINESFMVRGELKKMMANMCYGQATQQNTGKSVFANSSFFTG